jgi:hypothetical protein
MQNISREEFYKLVFRRAIEHDLCLKESYERIEMDNIKKHGKRRYISYEAFYHANYRAQIKAQQQRLKQAAIKGQLFDLIDKVRNGEITPTEMVREVTDKNLTG